jgi:NADPH:quinone reductase-like Zn-dependent oxidoreductase
MDGHFAPRNFAPEFKIIGKMTTTMQVAAFEKYGSPEVLQIKSVPKPQPKDHEICIKIQATAVTSGDCRLRRADPFAVRFFFGLFKPKKQVLGDGFSGVVESVGNKVKRFKVGEAVFGTMGMGFGAYSEYVCLPETGVVATKPDNLDHEAAATIHFGGATALHFLKKAKISAGQKVLIFGASGAVGTAAVQIAKHFGAEVTGVCSGANVEMVKSLGATRVVDYQKEDFAGLGANFDVVIDAVGKADYRRLLSVLGKNGTLVLVSAMLGGMLRGAWTSGTSDKKVVTGVAIEKLEDLFFLKNLLESGHFKSVVDKVFPMEKIAEAHRYVDGGHKKGNVAVKMGGEAHFR